jgi:hypothetical protein
MMPYIKHQLIKAFKEQEASPRTSLAKSFFFANFTTQSTSFTAAHTASGASIHEPLTFTEADTILEPVTAYLNKNLETLSYYLSFDMTTSIVSRLWRALIVFLESVLLPSLYGGLEKDRRILTRRQLSLMDWVVKLLKKFFHHDGLGVSLEVLECYLYNRLTACMALYYVEVGTIAKSCAENTSTTGLKEGVKGRNVELLVRLVRLRVERDEMNIPEDAGHGVFRTNLTGEERGHWKHWIETRIEEMYKF